MQFCKTVETVYVLCSQNACVCGCLCVCVCVCVHACVHACVLRIVSRDKILRFKNTFIIVIIITVCAYSLLKSTIFDGLDFFFLETTKGRFVCILIGKITIHRA